jgi:succinyl-diaminopimelate desuccinylase
MNDTILDLSKKLIAIPSTTDNNTAIDDVLSIIKQELKDFTIEEFSDNTVKSILVYKGNKRPETFTIMLNGHIDVVAAKDAQYIPEVKDEKLYGRGAYDMKSAVAVMIKVFKETAQSLSYAVGLQIVTDEETGGFHGTKYQLNQGVKADFVIAGENTDLLINNKAKGIMWVNLTTTGKASHGAYPWLGENAIWKLIKILDKVTMLFPIPQEESWKTSVNLAKIMTSNETLNKVPDNAVASLDIRYIPEDKEKLTSLLEELQKECEVTILTNESVHDTKDDNDYILKLSAVIKKITGKEAGLVAKHGGSDVRFYNERGSEGITFGPTGFGHHSDEEWVDLKSLEVYASILKSFLLSLS